MKTYLECIPCFFTQALDASVLAGVGIKKQKEIIDEVSKLIPELSLTDSPPKMIRIIHQLVRRMLNVKDPYKKLKKNSNLMALKMYSKLKNRIEDSEDSLLSAAQLSIIGNIIDYGAKNYFNVEEEINKFFQGDLSVNYEHNPHVFKYELFKDALKKVEHIVFLADNAGEVLFDRLLIEELVERHNKKVTYVVKDQPIINDALLEDAIFCGIDKYAKIISNGTDAPGTLLKYCSEEFLRLYKDAKLIISKGQGNYESLSEENKPIFFLFKAKCPLISRNVGCDIGELVLNCISGNHD